LGHRRGRVIARGPRSATRDVELRPISGPGLARVAACPIPFRRHTASTKLAS
jgi:hypothetical protein